ncbi:MAG: hypothetical protein AMJ89_05470 [candidate division Zixibacteria bacterium SM23_73]|nr:MAG: hypothetical protein AMJ89_05470 [candidate division Zixibacteria bacterium SM23_73]
MQGSIRFSNRFPWFRAYSAEVFAKFKIKKARVKTTTKNPTFEQWSQPKPKFAFLDYSDK